MWSHPTVVLAVSVWCSSTFFAINDLCAYLGSLPWLPACGFVGSIVSSMTFLQFILWGGIDKCNIQSDLGTDVLAWWVLLQFIVCWKLEWLSHTCSSMCLERFPNHFCTLENCQHQKNSYLNKTSNPNQGSNTPFLHLTSLYLAGSDSEAWKGEDIDNYKFLVI